MLLRTKYIGLNRYFYYRKVLGYLTPAYLYANSQQLIMYVVVFYPRHATSRAEIYYYARTSLYKELLTKLKATKVVADWFIQTNLLLHLLFARELARVKRGS